MGIFCKIDSEVGDLDSNIPKLSKLSETHRIGLTDGGIRGYRGYSWGHPGISGGIRGYSEIGTGISGIFV